VIIVILKRLFPFRMFNGLIC